MVYTSGSMKFHDLHGAQNCAWWVRYISTVQGKGLKDGILLTLDILHPPDTWTEYH